MKAEEILSTKKEFKEHNSYYHKKYIIEAMQEYARIQIEKDREELINDFMLHKDGEWANKIRNKSIILD